MLVGHSVQIFKEWVFSQKILLQTHWQLIVRYICVVRRKCRKFISWIVVASVYHHLHVQAPVPVIILLESLLQKHTDTELRIRRFMFILMRILTHSVQKTIQGYFKYFLIVQGSGLDLNRYCSFRPHMQHFWTCVGYIGFLVTMSCF
jgi:hypothetical protein